MLRPLSEADIADACRQSFDAMWNDPTAWQLRQHSTEEIARSIHSFGFHSAGELVSERDATLLDGLLTAAKRCLAHYDKIRPEGKEPSQMVEDLRKAVREMET